MQCVSAETSIWNTYLGTYLDAVGKGHEMSRVVQY